MFIASVLLDQLIYLEKQNIAIPEGNKNELTLVGLHSYTMRIDGLGQSRVLALRMVIAMGRNSSLLFLLIPLIS